VLSAALSRRFVSTGVCRILLIAVRTSRAAAASAYSPGVSASRQKPCMFHSGDRPMRSPAIP